MLLITKKADLKPVAVDLDYKSEKEEEVSIRAMLASGKELKLNEVLDIYQGKPSISAEMLAHIVHDIVAHFTETTYL
jgi:hypothetical protein